MTKLLDKIHFMGVDYSKITQLDAINIALNEEKSDFQYAVTPNAQHLVMLRQTPEFKIAYDHAQLVLNDSRVIKKLAYITKIELPLITGSDFTINLLNSLLDTGKTILIVGPSESIRPGLLRKFPGVKINILPLEYSLDKSIHRASEIAQKCIKLDWDYLLICLGCPLQEYIAYEIKALGSHSGFAICAGASVDFITGAQKRAPHWVQYFAMEWLFRLLTNPRRLWKRYLIESPKILLIWLSNEILVHKKCK